MIAVLLAAALLAPGAGSAADAAGCSASLASSELGDPRLRAAVGRLFGPGPRSIRVRLDRQAKPGGFSVDVRGGVVAVRAADAEGAFRGLAEAAGRCRAGRLEPGRASGSPGFPWRGVLEGFYGKPWTWPERRAMADWMSRHRLNLLVIAPKDDPGLRASWRTPLAREEREELERSVRWSRERFVEVAWTLSPGLDLDPSSPADLAAAAAKLEAAAAAGVRQLALAFDDVEPAKGHIRFANRVARELAGRVPGAEWTFVPAQYWGEAAPSPYLSTLARDLDPRFRVGWTGGQVFARGIGREESRKFGEYARHGLVLGDNYPVQDHLWGSGRLHWGPLAGREAGLQAFHVAYLANASPLAAASRVPLATAAEYAWDPDGYDAAGAWRRALAEAGGGAATRGGGAATTAVALFAAHNAASWLDPRASAAGPAARLAERLEAYAAGGPAGKLRGELAEISRLRRRLRSELRGDPELARQLDPWAAKLEAQAEAALAELDVDARPADRQAAQRFERLVVEADATPGVVAGQALDRFLHRGLAKLYGAAPPDLRPLRDRVERYAAGDRGAGILLGAALDRLAGAPAELDRAAGPKGALWCDALPWVGLLGGEAARAREALAGRRQGRWDRWWGERRARWRQRSLFVALAAARELMEELFAEAEQGSPKKRPWALRAWMAVERRRSPASLAPRLAAALEARWRGDDGPARALFQELAGLPAGIRQGMSGRLPEEGAPWLDKVGEYGRLGLRVVEGKAKGPEWEEARYRLRSSNGLELAFELKLELEALTRWLRAPAPERPALPESRLPADPRDML